LFRPLDDACAPQMISSGVRQPVKCTDFCLVNKQMGIANRPKLRFNDAEVALLLSLPNS
jgi:hypothetical protein